MIFKALSDETRRSLLDSLRQKDGQTLTELEQGLGMTRFGVMKHLKVLEEASLVVTRRDGRFKHHYLNAVPLQEILDRWIEPFRQKPLAQFALDLKNRLENENAMSEVQSESAKPSFVLETFIAASAEQVWKGITDTEITREHHFLGAEARCDHKVGGRSDEYLPDGSLMLGGEILVYQPFSRLEKTFEPHWGDGERKASRCAYELEEQGSVCKLTILHYDLPAEQGGVTEGWARFVAGLKTYLETG